MRSVSSSFACRKPRTSVPDELSQWARGYVLSPALTDQDRRERRIVATLLAELEASR